MRIEKKSLFILILLVGLVSVSGCIGPSKTDDTKDEMAVTEPAKTGEVDGEAGTEPTTGVETTSRETPIEVSEGEIYLAAALTLLYDPSGHELFVLFDRILFGEIIVKTGSITMEGAEPWVNVTGLLEEDGTFVATGKGVVAGYPNIAVEFKGTKTDTQIKGNYSLGVDGGLPGGQSIIYEVVLEKKSA